MTEKNKNNVTLSKHINITPNKNVNINVCGSPGNHEFLLPSPIITRRTRTFSACERAQHAEEMKGKVMDFCRNKGHGFIQPDDGSPAVFCHISDIDGEYVPMKGDEVKFKRILIPPKMEKHQAVHVKIIHFNPNVHETWGGTKVLPEEVETEQ